MVDRHGAKRVRVRQIGVAGLVLAGSLVEWLGACAAGAPSDPSAGATGARAALPADLPPGAIRVGRDLYQVPIGPDADGCLMYRLYSPTLLVTQAISYRSRDGGFTIDKRVAVCDPGPSADGPRPSG